MRRFSIVLSLVVVVLVAGVAVVSAQDINVNYVPGTDFSKFKTYHWVEIPGAIHPNQIVDGQIRVAIDKTLAAKGFTKATGDSADLAIDYQAAVTQEKEWSAYGMGRGYRMGGGMGTATSTTINVGTLVLDMYDEAAKQLVWKGQATKTLNPSKDPEKNQERLEKAMAKLLKDFPPKKK